MYLHTVPCVEQVDLIPLALAPESRTFVVNPLPKIGKGNATSVRKTKTNS